MKMNHLNAKTRLVGLLVSGIVVAIAAQLLVAAPAKADCTTPDGRVFPPGAKVGPYVCMPDGTWQTY